MNKDFTVFIASLQNEFVYRLNFILWRFRNVLRLLMTYFLWKGIFTSQHSIFGYQEGQILTYVFMVLIVSSIVMSAPSGDNIGSEIANGDLSNYLVKPMNYLKYWFIRDLASKTLNLSFNFIEITLLMSWLKPVITFPTSSITWVAFVTSLSLAIGIYFFFSTLLRLIAFWTPENIWPIAFLTFVFLETLSGVVFPLDILPNQAQIALQFTPFPYLIYYPIAIFLGKIQGLQAIQVLIQAAIWLIIMSKITLFIWHKGLRVYGAEGR